MKSLRLALAASALDLLLMGADAPSPKGYVCGRAPQPVVIDGKLDDDAWRFAMWTDDFVDIEGDAKPLPRFRTRVKMAWDDQYFYLAAELIEPHVQGTFTKHDSYIFQQDNDFEVFIDPDGDNHEYYEIEINALNTVWDLLLEKPYRDGGPAVDAWEILGLKTATFILGEINHPDGPDVSWTVEIAIPWKALAERAHTQIPPQDGDQWRINFSRVEWQFQVENGRYKKVPETSEANWVWSPQGVIDMHRPELWGYVQFSTRSQGQAAFRPDPSRPAQDLLMAVYHAQKSYHQAHQAWSATTEALGLANPTPKSGLGPVKIRLTPDGYEAEITIKIDEDPPLQTWSIRQDSRLIKKHSTG